MISLFAIIMIAAFQGALLIATAFLLVFAHLRTQRLLRAQRAGVDVVREPLRLLIMREDRGEALAAALATLDEDVATTQLLGLAGTRLGTEEMRELAPRLRPAAWVEKVLARGASRTWWRRMDAARLLAVVGAPRDRARIARLLVDPHPAVASAATDLIADHADDALIESVILGLMAHPSTVRQQHMRALRSHADAATAVLVPLLDQPASDDELRVRIQLAETLGTPSALAAVLAHAWNPNPSVRATVARALRTCFLPEGLETSHVLLYDDDWPVRAAAARALGGLQAVRAVDDLATAMRDESWWVRFRAALALRGLGERGEASLHAARASDDPYARDMATVVLGLSEASRLELSA